MWSAIHPVVSDVAGPSKARRFVAETLRAHHVAQRVEDAVLLTSELVTNAIVHGMPPVAVQLQCDGSAVRVEVHDASFRVPPVCDFSNPHRNLRGGIAIVDAIADDWGITPVGPAGKAVWFLLTSTPGR